MQNYIFDVIIIYNLDTNAVMKNKMKLCVNFICTETQWKK